MNRLSTRVTKRLKMMTKSFQSDCRFSIYFALLRICDEIGGCIKFNKISRWAHQKKDQWILNYLHKKLSSTIDNLQSEDHMGEFTDGAPIWICWWTGIETAPPLVKQCICSIKNNAGDHPVCFIDKDTYHQYIDIPEYMLKKVQAGHMGLAHLADYIRVALLEKYGGVWLDATIYCTQPIDEEIFKHPFFTCKSEPCECGYLSRMRWVTFVLGGWKNNIIYKYLREAFEAYWQSNEYAIDYLFFDHLIELGCQTIPAIKAQLDQVPCNNLHRDDLQAAMNAAMPAEAFSTVIHEDTSLYKLSWRETYSETTAMGEPSIYQYFLNM